jgi:hypothetical protein
MIQNIKAVEWAAFPQQAKESVAYIAKREIYTQFYGSYKRVSSHVGRRTVNVTEIKK